MAITLSASNYGAIDTYHKNNPPPSGSIPGICIYRQVIGTTAKYYAIYSYHEDAGMTFVDTMNPYDLPDMVDELTPAGIVELTSSSDAYMDNRLLIVVFFTLNEINNLMPIGGPVTFVDKNITVTIGGENQIVPSLEASGTGTEEGTPIPPVW